MSEQGVAFVKDLISSLLPGCQVDFLSELQIPAPKTAFETSGSLVGEAQRLLPEGGAESLAAGNQERQRNRAEFFEHLAAACRRHREAAIRLGEFNLGEFNSPLQISNCNTVYP